MTTSAQTAERRAHPRVRFRGLAVVRCGRADVPCACVDLSESGVRVRPRDPVALTERRVELLLGLYEGGWLPLSARMVRVEREQQSPRWAFRFDQPAPETQRVLQRVIAALAAAQVAAPDMPALPGGLPPIVMPALAPLPPLTATPSAAVGEDETLGDDVPTPAGPETTRHVLPEVMSDLAAKDPTVRLSVEELEALLVLLE